MDNSYAPWADVATAISPRSSIIYNELMTEHSFPTPAPERRLTVCANRCENTDHIHHEADETDGELLQRAIDTLSDGKNGNLSMLGTFSVTNVKLPANTEVN